MKKLIMFAIPFLFAVSAFADDMKKDMPANGDKSMSAPAETPKAKKKSKKAAKKAAKKKKGGEKTEEKKDEMPK